MQQSISQPQTTVTTAPRGNVTRARIVGGLGLIVAILLIVAVLRAVEAGATSTLTIPSPPQPGQRITAPLARIPLPTVPTVIVIQALLAVGGVFIAIRQPLRWIAPYVSAVIGFAFFTILLWAVAGSSVD